MQLFKVFIINTLCRILHMVCVYAEIIDAFQMIDMFYAIVTKKEKQRRKRKHRGTVDKSFSEQHICGGITIIFAVMEP